MVCSFKKKFFGFCLFLFLVLVFDGKSVMPMFCNAMLLLLYVHVCVTRTGWKTRPRPKTVILLIKQSINQSINQSLQDISLQDTSLQATYFTTGHLFHYKTLYYRTLQYRTPHNRTPHYRTLISLQDTLLQDISL